MQKIKQKTSFKMVFLEIFTYLSFCLAYWYQARGMIAGLFESQILANELVAALAAGILPFLLFELALRLYLQPLNALKIDLKGLFIRLRFYFIAANIICFALSFIYFAYPFLSVWGSVLINFFVYSTFLIVYLVNQFKKATDKTKAVFFVHRIGVVFLMFFGVISLIKVFLGQL